MTGLHARVGGVLLTLLAVAGALYGAYRHGANVTDLAWQAKWAKKLNAQSHAVANTTNQYRTEEQRRQKAPTRWQMMRDKNRPLRLLMPLALLATGRAVK